MNDIIRAACAVPDTAVANPEKNTERIIDFMLKAKEKNPDIVVFPELCITGYTCADLFFQQALLSHALRCLKKIIIASNDTEFITAVGLPLTLNGSIYNCAAVISGGKLWGIVPKTYIPTYNEFYERRWFTAGNKLKASEIKPSDIQISDIQSDSIPVGTDIIFDTGFFKFSAEICEDLWSVIPPSRYYALGGAEVIINLSASNETISKREYRKSLVVNQSASCLCAYVYTSAGAGESTTDLIFSGAGIVCENGSVTAENQKKIDNDYILFADIDLGKIRADRLKIKTFSQSREELSKEFRTVFVSAKEKENNLEFLNVKKLPFVPETKEDRQKRCLEIFEMQVMGLKKRIETTKCSPVVGVSGGLDSTLALLVSTEAAKRASVENCTVTGITMPAFGTTDRTYNNSLKLMQTLKIKSLEIPIRDAVLQHFKDIGQDPETLDLTYENSQARERTQVLMDYAGKTKGFVVGTGDLSELALGWCTYNADHMSMYGVNSSIPKTLIRWMIESIMQMQSFEESKEVLSDILDTPISPELLPPDASGKISQQTEEIVGPYALHDFFLYYTVRFGFTPEKICRLALKAFENDFDKDTVKKWLIVFYKRFFTQQYKRSCLPDGVKVGSICLSPRGDFRMPSDAEAELWIKRAEML